jgi:hypothetical protein
VNVPCVIRRSRAEGLLTQVLQRARRWGRGGVGVGGWCGVGDGRCDTHPVSVQLASGGQEQAWLSSGWCQEMQHHPAFSGVEATLFTMQTGRDASKG